jgi:hypothetical protein
MVNGRVQPTAPCEDCGGMVIVGPEPLGHDDNWDGLLSGQTEQLVDFCTNLDCPSNHALRGLTRVEVNRYICIACGVELKGPMSSVFAHRRTH